MIQLRIYGVSGKEYYFNITCDDFEDFKGQYYNESEVNLKDGNITYTIQNNLIESYSVIETKENGEFK